MYVTCKMILSVEAESNAKGEEVLTLDKSFWFGFSFGL